MPLVRLRGPLKQLAGDRAEHAVDGRSVGELLAALEREHPATSGWILDERGELRRHVNVFVDGDNVRWLNGLDTAVETNSTIVIVPAVSGG